MAQAEQFLRFALKLTERRIQDADIMLCIENGELVVTYSWPTKIAVDRIGAVQHTQATRRS
jgi:hypothetical protein